MLVYGVGHLSTAPAVHPVMCFNASSVSREMDFYFHALELGTEETGNSFSVWGTMRLL